MITTDNYLDFYHIFVNEIFGSIFIFLFFAIIAIVIITKILRFPWQVQIIIIVIFTGITYIRAGLVQVWAYVLLAIGVFFYYKLSNMITR